MKFVAIFGVLAACAVVAIALVVVLHTPIKKPLHDDTGTLSVSYLKNTDPENRSQGDFENMPEEIQNDATNNWYTSRKTTNGQGTFTPKEHPKTQDSGLASEDTRAVDAALSGGGSTTETNTENTGLFSQLVSNFWGEKNTDTASATAQPAAESDPLKKQLKDYGNAVGSKIKSFVEGPGKDQNDMLTSFIGNPIDNQHVLDLAESYTALADIIDETDAPNAFTDKQKKLSEGYRSVADGLKVLSEASTSDMYDKMITYNNHVESFGSAFVQFALTFGVFGVTFSPDEPGGIFTPPTTAM